MRTREESSAGGVVFRLHNEHDGFEVVLIRTHEGRWQLPKGWIEHGEKPAQAAIREVREESGIDAEFVGELDRIRYTYKSNYDPEPVLVRKLVHFFLLRHLGGSTEDHDDEVLEARWAEISEAEQMLAFKDEKRMVALAREALERVVRP